MRSQRNWVITAATICFVVAATASGGVVEDAKAAKVSGGEHHTIVLTGNHAVWVCGANGEGYPGYYYGVLGTGSNSYDHTENSLVRVHDGDMNTPSGLLEDINDVDAGWKHSLALDVNNFT